MRRLEFLESTKRAAATPVDGPHFPDGASLLERLREWGRALGFSQIGVAGIDLHTVEPGLAAWLDNGFHGEMDYMAAHGMKRARPAELVPGTLSVVTAPGAIMRGLEAGFFQYLTKPLQAVAFMEALAFALEFMAVERSEENPLPRRRAERLMGM